MSAAPTLVMHASDVRVEIVCPEPAAIALRAAWAPASRPVLPVRRTMHWEVTRKDGEWSLVTDGEIAESGRSEWAIALAIERAFVTRLREWHPDACVLHAALVEVGTAWVIFTGESGAGKSSLSLEAVRRGGRYMSDEFVITDAARVWGVGRSILFDICPPTAAMPERLRSADRSAYHLRDGNGNVQAVPIIAVPEAQWAREPVDAAEVVVVRVDGPGPDRVTPESAGEALATLIGAAYTKDWRELGPLAGAGRSFSITWTDPAHAISLLMEATSHLASDRRLAAR